MPEWKTETRRQNIPSPFSLTFQIMSLVYLLNKNCLGVSAALATMKNNNSQKATTTKTKTNTEQSEDVVIYLADLQNWKGIMVGIM